MLRKSLLVFCILCAAILIGCSQTGNSNTAADNSNKAAGTTGSSNTSGSSTTAAAGDKIGVAACDDYIAKYEACAPKVPEAGRAAYKQGLETMRTSWKKLAADPATKGSLEAACKQALTTQTAAWKAYGCE
jgi:succinate dehydrogenase/fumarate reductase-like Fe-S protein